MIMFPIYVIIDVIIAFKTTVLRIVVLIGIDVSNIVIKWFIRTNRIVCPYNYSILVA